MLVFLFSHIEHLNRQRQAVVLVLALKFLYPHSYRSIHSPFYHEPRTQDLYQNYMMNQWDDTQFKEYFRMDKASFHDLCERLAQLLEGGHTNYKESLSVQKKVAVSLSRLAGEVVPYRVHAMIFGIAPSTACKVFKDFVFAVIEVGVLFPLCKIVFAYHTSSIIILQIMRSEFVKHPSGQRMATIKAAFARKGFPNCLGALDGTHFKIAAPTYLQNYEDYYCLRKGSHTSQMQAVCDHDCIFWDVVLGRPGSVHDSRVLTNSNLYLKHQQILGDSLATLSSGDTVTPYILADGGYPNFEWLITVFPEQLRVHVANNWNEIKKYNKEQSKAAKRRRLFKFT